MPIRPELRHFYGAKWKKETRPRILLRAGDCCEFCLVPNRATVLRVDGIWTPYDVFGESGRLWGQREAPRGEQEPVELFWYGLRGAINCSGLLTFPVDRVRLVKIVLTVAHLNHVSGEDGDENLAALCQWCHLNHDKGHHAQTRATRKDAARPLLLQIPL
jgi:hypothetical protein